MTFLSPSVWLLLLLPLAVLAFCRTLFGRRRPAVAYSDVSRLRAAGGGVVASLRWIVPTLRMLGLALLIVCLARPVRPDEQVRTFVEGIAIELVVDRSASMLALDFELDDRPSDRLNAVKRVVRSFVGGSDEGETPLAGRSEDLIGLVVFARHADAVCPLTLDHDHLLAALDATEPATQRGEDGTAIGEGIALGVERLRDATSRTRPDESRRIQSKVMILLTDGENNAGSIDPREAAKLAASTGVRIHTIGAGSRGIAPFPAGIQDGRIVYERRRVSFDEEILKEIAESTGGRYFRATDTDSLREIYSEIDRLEKTRSEQTRSVLYADFAVQKLSLAGIDFPPLLLVVLAILSLETLLAVTRFRTLPG